MIFISLNDQHYFRGQTCLGLNILLHKIWFTKSLKNKYTQKAVYMRENKHAYLCLYKYFAFIFYLMIKQSS